MFTNAQKKCGSNAHKKLGAVGEMLPKRGKLGHLQENTKKMCEAIAEQTQKNLRCYAMNNMEQNVQTKKNVFIMHKKREEVSAKPAHALKIRINSKCRAAMFNEVRSRIPTIASWTEGSYSSQPNLLLDNQTILSCCSVTPRSTGVCPCPPPHFWEDHRVRPRPSKKRLVPSTMVPFEAVNRISLRLSPSSKLRVLHGDCSWIGANPSSWIRHTTLSHLHPPFQLVSTYHSK